MAFNALYTRSQELADEAKALPGNVSLNTYIVTLLTNSPDRKRVRRAKGK